ncbi:MAG: hypothetical protein U0L83_09225 [Muribaculaceae bacterium]|nr:hypothetical protein [Muribaculaceae bacterium]
MVKSVAKIFKGDGTLESPYLIETTEDMVKLADFIDLTSFDYSGFCFRLVNDLDFKGADWKIIVPNTTRFNANFDGNGKTISGYRFENLDNATGVGRFVGPFGVVGQSGAIRNLTVAGSFSTRQYAGGIAGDLYGVIDNCINRSTVNTTEGGSGGIVSRAFTGSTVSNCRNEGTVSGKGTVNGGIVATVKTLATVKDCVNDGNINIESAGVGGIAGESSGAIIGCRNLKPVIGTSSVAGIVANGQPDATEVTDCHNEADIVLSNTINGQYAAGIIGRTYMLNNVGSSTVISGCTNSGRIVAKGNSGGIVGALNMGATVRECVNTGTIVNTGAAYAGGILGNSLGATWVYDCVNHGKIEAHWQYAGGVAGLIGSIHGTATITNSYNAGEVVTEAAGGAAGVANIAGNGTLVDNGVYFDSDVMKPGSDDKSYMAKSTRELVWTDLGEGFIHSEASYPMPEAIAENATLAQAAALALTNLESDSADDLTSYVLIGNADKVDWTGSEHFVILNGKAYPAKLGQGTLTATSTDGKRVKTYSFNITKVSGVDGVEADKEVASRTYFDLGGHRIAAPAPGSVCIVRTVYTDGTSATKKLLVP